MKVSGFTIVRNVLRYHYPVTESIRSILPVCDEFVINVGDSEDETLSLMQALQKEEPKIRIMRTQWDFSKGKEVLSYQTNVALKECRGDWAFYLQSDEVIHENDLPRLKRLMAEFSDNPGVEALRFKWLHFYGSYYRYRIDRGWFRKQNRIIRNNGEIVSVGDACGFARKDGRPLKEHNTGCLLYHYGWVQPPDVMQERRLNAEQIGFAQLSAQVRNAKRYSYGDLSRFPPYFGSHPAVMKDLVAQHPVSQEDQKRIHRDYWWHPFRVFKVRHKTSRKVKQWLE